MMALDGFGRPQKLCFVTIGATASFNSLISTCLDPVFLGTLSTAGYTHLLVQYGKGGKEIFDKFKANTESVKQSGLTITGFDFKSGLTQELRSVKGKPGDYEGVVISHAGSGSILDTLRIDAPLIVVPNPDLLDNHQDDLAKALQDQGYVVHGKLDNLPAAITQSEELRKRHKAWPPVNSGQHRQAHGFPGVLDEETGFLD